MRDTYQTVTDTIIRELETGAAPWVKPWTSTGSNAIPHNAATGREYSGINVLLLWIDAKVSGYSTPDFLTFKQAKEAGGNVRAGQHGHRVIFVKKLTKIETNAAGDEVERGIPMMREYTVFNLDQCDGLDHLKPEPVEPKPALLAQGAFQDFVAATHATIRHEGSQACYVPSRDFISMPHALDFGTSASYKATLLHELSHWTGHTSRLARDLSVRFKTHAYAAEELIAELSAAFLCAHLGINGELRHAGYIETWLKLLRSDKKAIFTAASAASKAADYLRAFSEPQRSRDSEPQEMQLAA